MLRLGIAVVVVLSFSLLPSGAAMITDAQAKTKKEMIGNADRHDDELERETAEPGASEEKPAAHKKAEQAEAAVELPGATAQEEKPGEPASVAENKVVPAPASEPKSEAPEKKDWWKCYVATAAYGSYLDPHVSVLREFRDKYLLTNVIGRAFVNAYYEYSPAMAAFIAKHEALRTATRWALTPLVMAILHPFIAVTLIGFVAAFLVFYWMKKPHSVAR